MLSKPIYICRHVNKVIITIIQISMSEPSSYFFLYLLCVALTNLLRPINGLQNSVTTTIEIGLFQYAYFQVLQEEFSLFAV